VLGFLGTLCVRKGIHHLLDAVSQLRESYDIRVKMAGSLQIPQEKLVACGDFSEYLGLLSPDQIPGFFEDIDVLVLPSISEGVPMVQLESLAVGCPVIASTRCGDVVEDGRNGLLCEPGSTESLAQCLERVASDARFLDELRSNCRARLSDYTLNACAQRWELLIQEMVEASTRIGDTA